MSDTSQCRDYAAVTEVRATDPAAIAEIKRVAVKQLRMITIGVAGWRSS